MTEPLDALGRKRRRTTPWQERFWRFVTPGAPDACWEWNGSRNEHGYGKLNGGSGRILKASRASYELHYGVDPGDQDVLHTCDNPPCVNPAHLFLGDAAANAQDMARKGRAPAQNGQSLLIERITDAQVRELRERAATGEAYAALAAAYGIKPEYAGMLANGYARPGAGGPATRRVGGGPPKFSDATIREIRERVAAGEPQKNVAQRFGMGSGFVSLVVTGKRRAAAGGPIRST
jgi:hypothetical protein